MIAYRTAYLKANFPAQFMAALLNADYGDTERIAIEVHHARDMGIEVLPPDINESFATFTVVRDSLESPTPRLRFGLKAIKNVGDHIVEVIIAERKQSGPYQSIEDLLGRIHDKDLNKKSLESLIRSGALDSLGERNAFLLNIELLLQFARQIQDERDSGQGNLFAGAATLTGPSLTLPAVPPAPRKVVLSWEKELLGLYVTGHPLAELKAQIADRYPAFSTLKTLPKRRTLTFVGAVETVKRVTTKNGEPMLFAQLADYSAEVEAIVFPKVYKETLPLWTPESLIEITGKLDDKDGSLKILVESGRRFSPTVMQRPRVVIAVPAQMKRSLFQQLRDTVDQHPVGGGEGYEVELVAEGRTVPMNAHVSLEAIPAFEKLFGHDSVRVVR
jgi:DNA polymerase-3 subunit alpha